MCQRKRQADICFCVDDEELLDRMLSIKPEDIAAAYARKLTMQSADSISRLEYRDPTVEVMLRTFFYQRSKLKTINKISSLFTGFAMVAMVEFNPPKGSNPTVLIMYTLTTSVLVGIHLLALMISINVLPSVDFISTDERSIERIEFMSDKAFAATSRYISAAWIMSTFVGSLLFFVDISLVGYLQYAQLNRAAGVVVAVVPALMGSAFLFILYTLHSKMDKVRYAIRQSEINRLQTLILPNED